MRLPALGDLLGAHLRARLLRAEQAFDQDLHAPAAGLVAEQPRRDHPGVVEHQQVAGLQQLGQVADQQVLQRGRGRRAPPSGGWPNARAAAPWAIRASGNSWWKSDFFKDRARREWTGYCTGPALPRRRRLPAATRCVPSP